MPLDPSGSNFELFKDNASYRGCVVGLAKESATRFKDQYVIKIDADVDGELVTVSTWLNQSINCKLDGTPSNFLAFLNVCAGAPASARVTRFYDDEEPSEYSYRPDKAPEHQLLGSELIFTGRHLPRRDGKGTYYKLESFSAAPATHPVEPDAARAAVRLPAKAASTIKGIDPESIPE